MNPVRHKGTRFHCVPTAMLRTKENDAPQGSYLRVAVLWTLLNPRVFSKPKSTNNWASKSVLGERVWSSRDKVSIPNQHKVLPNVLSVIVGIGSIFVIWGTYKFAIWYVLFGAVLVYCGKLWFLDRMVWLFEDMKDNPQYKEWLY